MPLPGAPWQQSLLLADHLPYSLAGGTSVGGEAGPTATAANFLDDPIDMALAETMSLRHASRRRHRRMSTALAALRTHTGISKARCSGLVIISTSVERRLSLGRAFSSWCAVLAQRNLQHLARWSSALRQDQIRFRSAWYGVRLQNFCRSLFQKVALEAFFRFLLAQAFHRLCSHFRKRQTLRSCLRGWRQHTNMVLYHKECTKAVRESFLRRYLHLLASRTRLSQRFQRGIVRRSWSRLCLGICLSVPSNVISYHREWRVFVLRSAVERWRSLLQERLMRLRAAMEHHRLRNVLLPLFNIWKRTAARASQARTKQARKTKRLQEKLHAELSRLQLIPRNESTLPSVQTPSLSINPPHPTWASSQDAAASLSSSSLPPPLSSPAAEMTAAAVHASTWTFVSCAGAGTMTDAAVIAARMTQTADVLLVAAAVNTDNDVSAVVPAPVPSPPTPCAEAGVQCLPSMLMRALSLPPWERSVSTSTDDDRHGHRPFASVLISACADCLPKSMQTVSLDCHNVDVQTEADVLLPLPLPPPPLVEPLPVPETPRPVLVEQAVLTSPLEVRPVGVATDVFQVVAASVATLPAEVVSVALGADTSSIFSHADRATQYEVGHPRAASVTVSVCPSCESAVSQTEHTVSVDVSCHTDPSPVPLCHDAPTQYDVPLVLSFVDAGVSAKAPLTDSWTAPEPEPQRGLVLDAACGLSAMELAQRTQTRSTHTHTAVMVDASTSQAGGEFSIVTHDQAVAAMLGPTCKERSTSMTEEIDWRHAQAQTDPPDTPTTTMSRQSQAGSLPSSNVGLQCVSEAVSTKTGPDDTPSVAAPTLDSGVQASVAAFAVSTGVQPEQRQALTSRSTMTRQLPPLRRRTRSTGVTVEDFGLRLLPALAVPAPSCSVSMMTEEVSDAERSLCDAAVNSDESVSPSLLERLQLQLQQHQEQIQIQQQQQQQLQQQQLQQQQEQLQSQPQSQQRLVNVVHHAVETTTPATISAWTWTVAAGLSDKASGTSERAAFVLDHSQNTDLSSAAYVTVSTNTDPSPPPATSSAGTLTDPERSHSLIQTVQSVEVQCSHAVVEMSTTASGSDRVSSPWDSEHLDAATQAAACSVAETGIQVHGAALLCCSDSATSTTGLVPLVSTGTDPPCEDSSNDSSREKTVPEKSLEIVQQDAAVDAGGSIAAGLGAGIVMVLHANWRRWLRQTCFQAFVCEFRRRIGLAQLLMRQWDGRRQVDRSLLRRCFNCWKAAGLSAQQHRQGQAMLALLEQQHAAEEERRRKMAEEQETEDLRRRQLALADKLREFHLRTSMWRKWGQELMTLRRIYGWWETVIRPRRLRGLLAAWLRVFSRRLRMQYQIEQRLQQRRRERVLVDCFWLWKLKMRSSNTRSSRKRVASASHRRRPEAVAVTASQRPASLSAEEDVPAEDDGRLTVSML